MAKTAPSLLDLVRHPIHLLAFGCGSGLLRPGPGTWGSLFATVLVIPLLPWLQHTIAGDLFLLLTFLLGIPLCAKTSGDLGVPDHSGIVWDEFVGIWFILITFPGKLMTAWGMGTSCLVAFLLFRLFDIAKPFPIRQVERKTPGGFGIMIDDFLAACYVALILRGFAFVL